MTLRVLGACSPGEVRAAVVRDDELMDYAIWRPGAPDGVGDIHVGRVSAVVPAMAGAFVALIGADGFLPDSAGAAGSSEGTMLAVRITRAAQGGKGPRLAAVAWPEPVAGPPQLLLRGPGGLERLAALHPDAPVLIDDASLAPALRPVLGERLSVVPRAFDDAVETSAEALADRVVPLPGGGRMLIEPTAALVAIDLDAGSATSRRAPKHTAQMDANRAALPWLARAIRLRNLSGAILVDFAGLPARRRATLGPELSALLAQDELRPRLLGFTALGLAEIVRPRIHPPLHEVLRGPHAAGLTALRAAAALVAAQPGRLPWLRAAPCVVRALQDDTVALADLARRAGAALILRADANLPPSAWVLEEKDRA